MLIKGGGSSSWDIVVIATVADMSVLTKREGDEDGGRGNRQTRPRDACGLL